MSHALMLQTVFASISLLKDNFVSLLQALLIAKENLLHLLT